MSNTTKGSMTVVKTVIVWTLRAVQFVARVALVLLDDDAKEPPPPTKPRPKAPVPPPAPSVPPPVAMVDRQRAARARIKTLAPIPQATTAEGIVVALTRLLGEPTRQDKTSTDWYFGRDRVVCSVGASAEGEVGITIHDGPSPMTWAITERRTLDYAVRGLLWHLAEMDVFPLENAVIP